MASSVRRMGGAVVLDLTPSQLVATDANRQLISQSGINLATQVTGVLPVANGGTAVTTFGGVNTLLYTTAADTLASLASTPTRILTTDDAGAPQLTSNAPLVSVIDNFTNNNVAMSFAFSGTPVNFVTVTASDAASPPLVQAAGADANIDLSLLPKGTGNVQLSNLSYPNADGAAGEVLSTDGAGNLSFISVAIPPTPNSFAIPAAGPANTSTTLTPTDNRVTYVKAIMLGELTSGPNAGEGISIKLEATYKKSGGVVSRVGLVDDVLVNYDANVPFTSGSSMSIVSSASGGDVLFTVFGSAAEDAVFTVEVVFTTALLP